MSDTTTEEEIESTAGGEESSDYLRSMLGGDAPAPESASDDADEEESEDEEETDTDDGDDGGESSSSEEPASGSVAGFAEPEPVPAPAAERVTPEPTPEPPPAAAATPAPAPAAEPEPTPEPPPVAAAPAPPAPVPEPVLLPSRPTAEEVVGDQLETWQSAIQGNIGITRWGKDGSPDRELIRGGQSFRITTADRERNQRLIKVKRNDPFTNGKLIAIEVPSSVRDYSEIMSSAAQMSDQSLTDILHSPIAVLEEMLVQITDVPVLDRMVLLGDADGELPQNRVPAVKARLAALVDRSGMPDAPPVTGAMGADGKMIASAQQFDPARGPVTTGGAAPVGVKVH